jgi:hypothetical protein
MKIGITRSNLEVILANSAGKTHFQCAVLSATRAVRSGIYLHTHGHAKNRPDLAKSLRHRQYPPPKGCVTSRHATLAAANFKDLGGNQICYARCCANELPRAWSA